MEDLKIFQDELFVITKELYCDLYNKNRKITNLQIFLKYHFDFAGSAEGYVIGNEKDAYNLSLLLDDHEDITLESNQISVHYKADKIFIKNLYRCASRIYKVAKIEIDDLKIIYYKSSSDNEKRKIHFYVDSCNNIWKSCYNSEREPKIFDEMEKRRNETISLNKFNARIVSTIINDYDKKEKCNIQKGIYYVELFLKEETNTINDDEFILEATDEINAFLLISSFISDFVIHWYYYIFDTSNKRIDFYNRFFSTGILKDDYNELLIDPWQYKEFMETAILKLNHYSKKRINLRTPIINYLTCKDSHFFEQNFILLYIAFETLCNELSQEMDIEFNISNKNFKKLRVKIESIINDFFIEEDIDSVSKQNLLCKMPELRRAPIRFVIESMFRKFNIDISDLYDVEGKIKFLTIRNLLTHTTGRNKQVLISEYYKLKKYFILLMLNILGCEKGIVDTNSIHLILKNKENK
jgi:hypothetical protein